MATENELKCSYGIGKYPTTVVCGLAARVYDVTKCTNMNFMDGTHVVMHLCANHADAMKNAGYDITLVTLTPPT